MPALKSTPCRLQNIKGIMDGFPGEQCLNDTLWQHTIHPPHLYKAQPPRVTLIPPLYRLVSLSAGDLLGRFQIIQLSQ